MSTIWRARACVFCVTLKHPSESIKLNVSHSFLSLSLCVSIYLFPFYHCFRSVSLCVFLLLSLFRVFCHTFVLEILFTVLSQMHFKRINSSRKRADYIFFAENHDVFMFTLFFFYFTILDNG